MAPSATDDYTFDLQGFLELKGALSLAEVAALNAELDAIPPMENQQWHGRVHRQDYQRPGSADGTTAEVVPQHPAVDSGDTTPKQDWGTNLQNIVEAGPAFESLIDHPSWLAHVRRYVGVGKLFIDEAFVTTRSETGAGSPLHSGAHKRTLRTQFRYHDGQVMAVDPCSLGGAGWPTGYSCI
jgi:hypothetical protein